MRTRSFAISLAVLGSVLACPLSEARADPTDGAWAVAIEQAGGRCRWEGSVRLAQQGKRIEGSGEARPVAGKRCPILRGAIEGTVNGRQVRFGFATGGLGTARFDGTLGADARTMTGRWRAGRAAGTWWADRAP
jgi:hypothetical protein